VTYDHNEGGAAPPDRLDIFIVAPAVEAEAVVMAMCLFTAAGC
jgi:hypothetical protein